jgi:hypothetical protein
MAVLFESDFPNKHRDFQQILENERESPELRYVSALYLGKMNAESSRQILLGNLNIEDDFVLSGVMKALGWIGDRHAFEAVSTLGKKAGERASAQARFAAALIAHRLGLDGGESLPPSIDYLDPGRETGRRLSIQPADPNEGEMCLRAVSRHPLGVEYDESSMYQLRCGRNSWMLLFNRDSVGGDAAQRLRDRKLLFGAVAHKSSASNLYVPVYVILTSPHIDAVRVLVHRVSGRLEFGGAAEIEGDGVRFSIRAVVRPGAFAVWLDGRLEGGRLTIGTALANPAVSAPKTLVVDA